uniref:Methyltransferase domain-containing protein n=1 Tax=Kwoniella pini CBS 10737 TaxID=1296096 RepID=A0A1B9I4U3_9TREE|nr:uncharacterized protein I206_03872 [Kwoniella pini CBS 10737]OCF50547.1 hypothetical protein I206_03872 [Kwoniella pini CBS 10737]
MNNWPFSSNLSETSSDHSVEDVGPIQWRDRTIWTVGKRGGWPIDVVEQERREAEHHLLRILLGHPFYERISEILKDTSNHHRKKVLDVGTGEGTWAIEMADLFPHVKIIGIDEVAIQPVMVPPNCEMDLSKALPYPAQSLDIIHLRFLVNKVPEYLSLISQSLHLLKSGGLLLIFDNFTIPQDDLNNTPKGIQAFHDSYNRSLKTAKIQKVITEDIINILRGNGEIKGDLIKVPINHGNGRMKQLSKIHLINLKAWVESTKYMIIEYGEYTDSEFDILSRFTMLNNLGREIT